MCGVRVDLRPDGMNPLTRMLGDAVALLGEGGIGALEVAKP